MELGNSTVKTPEAECETPTRIQSAKPSPFTNGVLKRHAPHHRPIVVTYKECLKNHAATIGGHAVDGCGEFMPSPTSNPAEPSTLRCAACGCHRNFHRRDPDDLPALDYQPHHRHHPPPPPLLPRAGSPINSSSPPPISSSYAPHMLLALSHSSLSGPHPPDISNAAAAAATTPSAASSGSRKRFRSKFSQDQKDRMLELAEKVGWKMQKKDEDVINEACTDIGVDKGVFKVWMHNNKNISGKKETSVPPLSQAQLTNHSPEAATGARNGVNYGGDGGGGYQDMKQNPELNQLDFA